VVVRLDLENGRPPLSHVDGAGVLTRALQHIGAAGREAAQQRLGSFVRAVLRPEHTEHPQLDLVWLSLQLFDDDAVLLSCEGNFAQPLLVYLFYLQDTRTRIADSATERNSLRPSVPPSSASEQRSG